MCGRPVTKSLPLTSIFSFLAPGNTVPISNFISSAVLSPINNLYFSLIYFIISLSNVFPATLIDEDVTIPPNDNTATSVVPPPISITIFPLGFEISIPAPTAATFGSSSRYTFLAPVFSAASLIAFFSTCVMFDGQHINILGLPKKLLPFTFLIKLFNIISVISKSAITPSFIGLIAFTCPGVLPNISLATVPTATGLFVSSSIATTLGSFRTIPWPLI